MRYQDIKSGRVNLTQRAIEKGGWLSALPRDPAADPPEPRERTLPAPRSDFDPPKPR